MDSPASAILAEAGSIEGYRLDRGNPYRNEWSMIEQDPNVTEEGPGVSINASKVAIGVDSLDVPEDWKKVKCNL